MTTVCFTSLTEGRPSWAVTQAAFGQKNLAWLFGFLFLLLFWLALSLLSQSLFWSFVVGCLALGMDPFCMVPISGNSGRFFFDCKRDLAFQHSIWSLC